MILVCKEEVKDSLEIMNFFTRSKTYKFINGRDPKNNKYIGYIVKDDLGLKRWITEEFKEQHFQVGE